MTFIDPHDFWQERAEELEAAIRQHRDDRCHADDGRLCAVLPEGDTRPLQETLVTIENCAAYIACRSNPSAAYVSPQRRIEELEGMLREAVALLRELHRKEEEDCWHDHNGFCQAHSCPAPCVAGRARAFLAGIDAATDPKGA